MNPQCKQSTSLAAVAAGVVALWCAGAHAQSYPSDLFSVNQLHFDAVRSPRGLDWYLQSREAKAVIGSISAYMGVNPRYVTLAVASMPKAEKRGEETWYELGVAGGYSYCSARIAVTSLVPADGDRASSISASVYPGGTAKIYTWTPVRHFGEGQSWVEGDLQVTGILPSYQDEFIRKGICAPLTQQIGLLECKGNPCSPGYHGGSQKGEAGQKEPALAEGV